MGIEGFLDFVSGDKRQGWEAAGVTVNKETTGCDEASEHCLPENCIVSGASTLTS